MIMIANNAVLLLLCCVFLCGCNSIATYSYSVSQTVARTAIQESKEPKELNGKALVILYTSGNTKINANIRNSQNSDYGEAVIDGESFAAFMVVPGNYHINWKPFAISANECHFVYVDQSSASPVSSYTFKNYCSDKFLVKNCRIYGNVYSVENSFVSKVSGWEVFWHNTWATTKYTFKGLGYVIIGAGIVFLLLMEAKAESGGYNNPPPVYNNYYIRPIKVVPSY